jgi:hypothetical protein
MAVAAAVVLSTADLDIQRSTDSEIFITNV